MSTQEFSKKSEKIKEFVGEKAKELGRSSKFVQRRSKMTSTIFIQSLLLCWLNNPCGSLSELALWAKKLGVQISPQGIGKRFGAGSLRFLQEMFKESLEQFQSERQLRSDLLKQFNGVFLLDSSQISLPEALQDMFSGSGGLASKAATKIQMSFEYLSGSLNALGLVAGRSADTHCQFHLESAIPDSLHLFDLGYFKLVVFEKLAQAGAYFITRFRPHTCLFTTPHGTEALDLAQFCTDLRQTVHEETLYLGTKFRIPVRVLFQKVPGEVAAQRRRKAQAAARRKGRTASQKHLNLLDWGLYITNVPAEMLTFEEVLLVYRVRWQIELIFKLCKSQLQMDEVGTCGYYRIFSQLYARLIIFVLFCGLVAPWRVTFRGELSFPKAFQVLALYAYRFLECFTQQDYDLAHTLQEMADDFLSFAQKTKRKKSPSTFRRLVLARA